MPKRAEPLTAVEVKNAKPGSYVDGGGLMLVVGKTSASWMLRDSFGGKRRDMGLGPECGAAALSLADARGKAAEAHVLIKAGLGPAGGAGGQGGRAQGR
jgi:hypothetical protein